MQPLLSPETFEFFARFLLAGFVMLSVRSRFVATQRPKPSEAVLDAVVLSLVNQAVFQLIASLLGLLPVQWIARVEPLTASRFPLFFEVLVLPTLLGLFFARTAGSKFANGFLRKLSMPGTHPVARAYDHAFAQHSGPSFVILTFNDGLVIYGYFGEQSLAATDPDRSDIYLERLYTLSKDGRWVEADPARGVWVSLSELRLIEFIYPEAEGT